MGKKKLTRIKLMCSMCKKKFERPPWQYKMNLLRKTKKMYCSHKCYDQFQKINHSPNWKGGRRLLRGYVEVWCPPEVNPRRRIFEHRLIMQKHLRRKLTNREFVHHKNGVKTDNRIENLEIVHLNSHRGNVQCPHCLKTFCIR